MSFMKSCSLTIRLKFDLEQELQLMRFERLRRQALPCPALRREHRLAQR